MSQLSTPYYLIDKSKLLANTAKMDQVRALSGAKVLLALKCFATWCAFDLMNQHMDGTTSSSLYEVKLGAKHFGGETHAYSVAYADDEIDEVISCANKIIFNSLSQFERYSHRAAHIPVGLRLNPGVSSSSFDLADPARPFSRLGEWDAAKVMPVIDKIDGFMVHNNCENGSFELFDKLLTEVEERFGELFHKVRWVSLGGGIHFTGEGYPIEALCVRLKAFAQKYDVQVYLEPGEAAITQSTTLEVTVLDKLVNQKELLIVDSSVEAHMLDLLIYRETAKLAPNSGDHSYLVCGKSCLAGDIFGEFRFPNPVQIGDRLSILDAAGYTMVKKNWFNGVKMPSIAIKELDGTVTLVRDFSFADYEASLS